MSFGLIVYFYNSTLSLCRLIRYNFLNLICNFLFFFNLDKAGRLQSIGSQRVGDDWSDSAHMHTYILLPCAMARKSLKARGQHSQRAQQSCFPPLKHHSPLLPDEWSPKTYFIYFGNVFSGREVNLVSISPSLPEAEIPLTKFFLSLPFISFLSHTLVHAIQSSLKASGVFHPHFHILN